MLYIYFLALNKRLRPYENHAKTGNVAFGRGMQTKWQADPEQAHQTRGF